jgi:hypothetical protein
MAGGIAEVEKLANVVAASVGVPDQGQCKRTAQRFGNWAVRRLAEAADQLAPPARCRVELDTRQVICRSRRIDALQLERHSTFQETMFGGSRYLGTASQHHDTESCLPAQRPQDDRPQLSRDLIEPVQDHSDPAGSDQLGTDRATLADEERVGLLEPAGQPILDPLGVRIPLDTGSYRPRHELERCLSRWRRCID